MKGVGLGLNNIVRYLFSAYGQLQMIVKREPRFQKNENRI